MVDAYAGTNGVANLCTAEGCLNVITEGISEADQGSLTADGLIARATKVGQVISADYPTLLSSTAITVV